MLDITELARHLCGRHPRLVQGEALACFISVSSSISSETLSKMHNNHLLSTYKRKDVDQLNEHMRKFPSCQFVAKDVASWKARRDDGEKSPR